MNETFFEKLHMLDVIITKGPDECDYQRDIAPRLTEDTTKRYFFEHLQDPAWISTLANAGIFDSVPTREIDQGSTSYWLPPWWPAPFLARVALIDAEAVVDALRHVPSTSNARAWGEIIEVLSALPVKASHEIIENWRERFDGQTLFPEKTAVLVAKLAEAGEGQLALDIARRQLMLAPPQDGDSQNPMAHMNLWDYEVVLRHITLPLLKADSKGGLALLTDLLETSIVLTKKGEGDDDYSYMWRPAVEDHQQNQPLGIKSLLVTAIRDAVDTLALEPTYPLTSLIAQLEQRPYSIFTRLALSTLALHPRVSVLVQSHLTDRHLFDRSSVRHEYTQLVQAGFALLTQDAQALILGWITNGPSQEEQKRFADTVHDATAGEHYADVWRRDWFARLGSALPLSSQQMYRELIATYGPAEHPDFPFYLTTSWEMNSTDESLDVSLLTPDNLYQRLTLVQRRQQTSHPFQPDRDLQLLQQALTEAVVADPLSFSRGAGTFKDPHLHLLLPAYLMGLDRATDTTSQLTWEPIMDLCMWSVAPIISQPEHEFPAEDATTMQIAKTMAHLIGKACQQDQLGLPFTVREQIWTVLQALIEHQDPTPEKEHALSMTPTALSINTVRGAAWLAIIDYALWGRRKVAHETSKQINEEVKQSIAEVLLVLERHLDIQYDPSLAIHSLYGQRFPWLVVLDGEWAREHVASIFPLELSKRKQFNAAWGAYVLFCPPYDQVWDILRPQYEQVTMSLGDDTPQQIGWRLAEHVMTLYWRGKLSLDSGDLVDVFFGHILESLHAHALEFVGRSLANTKGPVPPEIIVRLQQLWEERMRAIRSERQPNHHRDEFAAFGWWTASSFLPDTWVLDQLEAILSTTGQIDAVSMVIDRLSKAAAQHPLQVMTCLLYLVESHREAMTFPHSESIFRSILESVLQDDNLQVHVAAERVINLLGERGYLGFRDLVTAHADSEE